jgi:ABC-type Na+ efflux pump permease subunit
MWNLAFKDLEQNWKSILIFFTSSLAFPITFAILQDRGSNVEYLGVVFGYIVLGGPILFSYLLIGQEKVKGTFKFLRVLPISGTHIILTKSLTVICLCLINLDFALILEPLMLRLFGLNFLPSSSTLLWLNLTAIFFAAISILITTYFNHKTAAQISYSLIAGLVWAVAFMEKHLLRADALKELAIEIASQPTLSFLSTAVICSFAAGLILLASYTFNRIDWVDLEEN